MAILAGDALLTLAFEALAGAPAPPAQRVALIAGDRLRRGNARRHGGRAGGRPRSRRPAVTAEMLEYIHRSKTAALIRASIVVRSDCRRSVAGTIWSGCARFGELIGWAFQVTDDILDVEESSAALGKTAGKDQAQQKATYPALFGLEKSHEFARELATRAMARLETFGARAANLRELGEFLVLRRA